MAQPIPVGSHEEVTLADGRTFKADLLGDPPTGYGFALVDVAVERKLLADLKAIPDGGRLGRRHPPRTQGA